MLSLFLAPSVAGNLVVLEGEEARHAASVVRLRVGERVQVSDGVSESIEGVVISVAKQRVEIEVQTRKLQPPSEPRVVVAQALAKGDGSVTAVELLTEVGVDEILPWSARRSIAKWDGEKIAKGQERWSAVAREASKQSRRVAIPVIGQLHSTEALAERIGSADCAIVLHEGATQSFTSVDVPRSGEVLLVVGPEGGIDESEIDVFRDSGAHIVRLGPSVLRSAHAGCVGATLILSRNW